MSVATLLGFGAVAVLLASVVAAFVRQPDAARHRVAAPHVVHAPSAPTAAPSTTPVQTPSTKRHHVPIHVLGKTVHRAARGQAQNLPFTGPAPVVPTGAIGLVAIIGGAWMLVRWPAGTPSLTYDAAFADGFSVTARKPRSDGAIDRLRSPGHQLARPSSAATDGTSNERTTKVSSSNPAVTAKPVS